MQFSKLAIIASVAALAQAQSVTLADFPTCALQPGLQALGATGCSTTDFACACSNSAFVTSLTQTVNSVCSAADIQKTIQVATQFCAQYGVTLSLPGPTGAASAASSASSSAPASSSAAPVSTTSATSTSTAVAMSTTTSVAASTTSKAVAPIGTGNVGGGNKTVTPPPATSSAFTGAAAAATAMSGPLAAGGIFGVAALLLAL